MIEQDEILEMLSRCALVHDPVQLQTDYGEEAERMMEAFAEAGKDAFLPLLAWYGIGTRWQVFLRWLNDGEVWGSLEEVFAAFASHLGRLTSYRALALTPDAYRALQENDAILSSGHMRADARTVADYLRRMGLRQILERRMNRLNTLEFDPSLSLHDDPETAVSVASSYLRETERPVYRFELDVPVIETVGWRMCDVNGWAGWFAHQGIWHDPSNARTERFGLMSIPYFAARCKSVRIFTTGAEIADYIRPFAEQQQELRSRLRG